MNKIIFLLIATSVVFANAKEDIEFIAKFQQIDSTSFGRYVLDMIQLQMETGSTIERLLNTLHDLEDQYNAGQKEDDNTHNKFQEICDEDIVGLDRNLANGEQVRIELEAKLEGELLPLQAIEQGIIRAKQTELSQYQASLNEALATRAEEQEIFEQKVNEHHEAAQIITQVMRMFKDNLVEQSKSFIQKHQPLQVKPNALVEINDHLKIYALKLDKQQRYRKSYSSILRVLLTITSNIKNTADQGSVQRIIDLCEKLLQKISQSVDLERFAEEKRLQAFDKYANVLNIYINTVQGIYAQHQATLQSIQDRIEQTTNSHTDVVQRHSTIFEERSDRYQECELEAFTYKNLRKMNDQKRTLVSDIIGLVNQNLRWLKEQIALRIAAGDQNVA